METFPTILWNRNVFLLFVWNVPGRLPWFNFVKCWNWGVCAESAVCNFFYWLADKSLRPCAKNGTAKQAQEGFCRRIGCKLANHQLQSKYAGVQIVAMPWCLQPWDFFLLQTPLGFCWNMLGQKCCFSTKFLNSPYFSYG